MPTCNRLTVPLTFKQFFSAVLLRIFPIQNFVPRTSLSLRDVRAKFLLGNDALQIQFGLAEIMPSRSSMYSVYFSGRRLTGVRALRSHVLSVVASLSASI